MKWISVDERLPGESGRYRVKGFTDAFQNHAFDEEMEFNTYKNRPGDGRFSGCFDWKVATHWMPLHTPPTDTPDGDEAAFSFWLNEEWDGSGYAIKVAWNAALSHARSQTKEDMTASYMVGFEKGKDSRDEEVKRFKALLTEAANQIDPRTAFYDQEELKDLARRIHIETLRQQEDGSQ